ncbi:MAG: hypothetical protein IPM39_18085 [Chloroflexi bacterium]|nr:hypothetical protein [Chloroflexota bacterium]
MSAHDLDTLLKKWERDELSTEQAVGQMMLLLQSLSRRVGHLEVAQENKRRLDKPARDNS